MSRVWCSGTPSLLNRHYLLGSFYTHNNKPGFYCIPETISRPSTNRPNVNAGLFAERLTDPSRVFAGAHTAPSGGDVRTRVRDVPVRKRRLRHWKGLSMNDE
ncbi:hypothetical protein EVAR_18947_1 [Eumeta japonica]|uniref:Uncharacterized protein n=1 Tax=Eumeta variegata TaxID=151549 RepID=A0A4C1V3G6_EUMVA|nr:hypothetical protein EVAR_18947_1 [Eumeta japonica]